MLLERVAGTILGYNMARPAQRIGVAVSGGADSVFLLHALDRLAERLGIQLAVLHLNHGLRGADSDEDERFVQALAAWLNLPCHRRTAGLRACGGNLEEAARQARLAFFRDAMLELGLDRVATGHTLNDQAETLLFRMVRGTGATGLRGIQPVTAGGLIRPLLAIDREEARAWLTRHGLAWREDHTNQDIRLARNFVRHDILPRMEASLNPAAAEALARLAGLAAEDEDYWAARVEEEWAALAPAASGGACIVDARRLAAHHPALGKRLVRRLLLEVSGSLRRFTHEHVETVWRLAGQSAGSGRARLPKVEVRRSLHWLRIGRAGLAPQAPLSAGLAAPGRVRFGAVFVEVTEAEEVGAFALPSGLSRYNVGSDLLDAERVAFPLEVRCWRAGDAYRPAGHTGETKVKQLFGPAGVPSWDRPLWPIVLSAGRIVWCRRFGTAAWAAAGPESRRALRIREATE